MFCPSAIEWGNAADWASAVASGGAVIAAVWIAFGQERSARRIRKLAENDAHSRRAHLIAEVIRLAGEIESVANSGAMLVGLGGGISGSLTSHRDSVESLRSQLRALQEFPQADPRVFGEIGRIVHASELTAGFSTGGTSYQAIVLREVAGKMAERRAALAEL